MEDDVVAPTADSMRPGEPEFPQRRTLAATQLAVLAAEAWAPDPSSYTLVSTVEAVGIPDWPILIDTVHRTLHRHDVFSWRLSLDSSYQLVAVGGPETGTTHEVEQIDLRGSSRPDAHAAVQDRLRVERRCVIPLLQHGGGPTTRVLLFCMPADQGPGYTAVCSLITHHAIVDEYSTELLWNEVFRRAAQQTTAERNDRGFAEWAAESVAPLAVTAGRQAADEVVQHLGAARLNAFPQRCSAPSDAAIEPPLRFTVPIALTAAVAARATALGLPAAALHAAALMRALARYTGGQDLAVRVPMARRRSAADLESVGCYITSLPVLAQGSLSRDSIQQAARKWHGSLRFTSDRAHADVGALHTMLGGTPQISLTFENRGARHSARPISWVSLPPPDSSPKADLHVFLSPGNRHRPGDGRILWRPGILNRRGAQDLINQFLTYLA
ncbi:condensation domain-containing protein (plasmid) [Streptomyces sp. NBC_00015]|uniref:condensation domain-containing protein n=1 Tax=Streptomyces sp. NBC_00015 TaxID=2903611 RepID=UPI002F907CE2